MFNKLLSIVIPVYNCKETLPTCLNSILSQNFGGFEIILIDNGSTDATKALCDGYKEKEPRIKVLHIKRDSIAAALNAGIEMASGRYLFFMNATDYIEDGGLDILETQGEQRQENYLPDNLWGKLIRRNVLTENDLKFDTDNVWEDEDFCMSLYVHASTYGDLTDLPHYQHMPHEDTRNPKEWCQKIILTLSKWTSMADLQHQRHETVIHYWMAEMYCEELIPFCGKLTKAEMQAFKHSVDDFAWLMDIRENRLDKRIKFLYNIVGAWAVGRLIVVFDNLKSLLRT